MILTQNRGVIITIANIIENLVIDSSV